MENNEPRSQSLCLWVWETAQWERELSASCKEGSLEPRGQQDRWSPQSRRAEPPAADARGDQHGVEQHSGVWSLVVSAVVWSLPQLYLEGGIPHPSGSLTKCLGTPMASGEFSQEPVYGWSCSANMAVLLRCADILGVPPWQICLAWLR